MRINITDRGNVPSRIIFFLTPEYQHQKQGATKNLMIFSAILISRATKSQYGQFFLPAQNAMKQAQNKFQLCTTCGIEVIRSNKVKMLR